MRILYFDCFAGVAGDMFVAALRDLGVGEAVFSDAIGALGLGEEIHAHFSRDTRQGISGWRFHVHGHGPDHVHHHHASGGEKHHVHGRNHAEIRSIIQASGLDETVKERVLGVFLRIAEAEGAIHGVPADTVGFHEVGAVDSIADIVAACAGIHALGVDRIESSPLIEGRGIVRCAHGDFPLPAPATLAILKGIPLAQIDVPDEMVTPTGAALMAEFSQTFGMQPSMRVSGIGYGLGTRDPDGRPNVLRAILGESVEGHASARRVVVVESNLDDCSPEVLAHASQVLFEHGALDVYFTPIQMKKGRPGTMLSVMCGEGETGRFARLILRETTAFGVRITPADRLVLDRETITVETEFGEIDVKLGRLEGEMLHCQPEFESCRKAAIERGVPISEVFLTAMNAGRKAR